MTEGTEGNEPRKVGRWIAPPADHVMKRHRLTQEQYDRLFAIAARYDVPILDLAARGRWWVNRDDARLMEHELEEIASRIAAHHAEIDERTRTKQEAARRRKDNAEKRRAQRAAATHRRPRQQGTPRARSVTIRVSDEEYAKLTLRAKKLQISLSAYLVESGLGRRIRSVPTATPTATMTWQPSPTERPAAASIAASSEAVTDSGATAGPAAQREPAERGFVLWRGGPPQYASRGPATRSVSETQPEPDPPSTPEPGDEPQSHEGPEVALAPTETRTPDVPAADESTQLDLGLDDRREPRKKKRG